MWVSGVLWDNEKIRVEGGWGLIVIPNTRVTLYILGKDTTVTFIWKSMQDWRYYETAQWIREDDCYIC